MASPEVAREVSFPGEAMGAAHDKAREGKAFVDAVCGLGACGGEGRGRSRHLGDPSGVARGCSGFGAGQKFRRRGRCGIGVWGAPGGRGI
jgi:hypothetical protein